MTLDVKVALNPITTNQQTISIGESNTVQVSVHCIGTYNSNAIAHRYQ